MRVLVTGSKGFVGGHLLPRLAEEGWEVTGTDLELDVTDAAAVAAAFVRVAPDAVIHLAAQSSVAVSQRDPSLTHRVNVTGARSVLSASLNCPSRPRVLLIGSSDQYGTAAPGSAPIREASPQRPSSAYAQSKTEAEELGAAFAAKGLAVVRIRAFSHSGPGQTDRFVLSSFARQTVEIETGLRAPLIRVGNLDSVRDFLDVSDVVEAYIGLLDPGVPPDIYNVASGIGVRLGDLLDSMLAMAGVKASLEPDPERFRPSDFLVGDASRLRAATGWEPRIPIEHTLAALLDFWRQQLSDS